MYDNSTSAVYMVLMNLSYLSVLFKYQFCGSFPFSSSKIVGREPKLYMKTCTVMFESKLSVGYKGQCGLMGYHFLNTLKFNTFFLCLLIGKKH